jgi:hypothetical protein
VGTRRTLKQGLLLKDLPSSGETRAVHTEHSDDRVWTVYISQRAESKEVLQREKKVTQDRVYKGRWSL